MKVAVILPIEYAGGTLRLFLNLVRYFASHSGLDVVVGIPEPYLDAVAVEIDQIRLEFPHIEIRGFTWKTVPPAEAKELLRLQSVVVRQFISESYQVPLDGHDNFLGCDFWFVVSDRLLYPLIPLRPYGLFVTDHLQRYVPEIFDTAMYQAAWAAPWNFLRAVRNANLTVVMSEATARDVEAYSGCLHTIVQVPTTIDLDHFRKIASRPEACQQSVTASPYCVWVTNSSQHKNHLRMLQAIRQYFDKHGGGLDVVVTGHNTELFNPRLVLGVDDRRWGIWKHPYVAKVREAVGEIPEEWKERIHWVGCVADAEYIAILRNSCFLVHNVLADNGTFSVVEAGILGCPAMSSDYPQMRQIDEQFGLGLHFFDGFDPAATAVAMSELEGTQPHFNSDLLNAIGKFTWRAWDDTVVDAIETIVGAPRKEIACL